MTDRSNEPQDPHPRKSGHPGLPTDTQVTDAIARDIQRIHEESYGRGASTAIATVVGDFVIVVLDELNLLPNEEFLVQSGKQEAVAQVRHQYQNAIQALFSAAVERATGRRVIGFQSTTSVDDHRFMVEIFRLEAVAEAG